MVRVGALAVGLVAVVLLVVVQNWFEWVVNDAP